MSIIDSKKVAIMQPYFFPYIGYYQLVNESDVFVFYDDVNYINKGYIDRNTILTKNGPLRFSISVPGKSQNKLINELDFSHDVKKLLKTIEQSYRNAPYFNDVFPLVKEVVSSKNRSVAFICSNSVIRVLEYLNIEKKIVFSSDIDYERDDGSAQKLLSITKILGGSVYVNSPGGRKLYSKEFFEENMIKLEFIDSEIVSYRQFSEEFEKNLSMIDVLMWNDKDTIIEMLSRYEVS